MFADQDTGWQEPSRGNLYPARPSLSNTTVRPALTVCFSGHKKERGTNRRSFTGTTGNRQAGQTESMNTYQKEHRDTFRLVMAYLDAHSAAERNYLFNLSKAYVDFRRKLEIFQQAHVAEFCAAKCYQSRLSACCSRDSIVVYFADVVVNCLHSGVSAIDRMVKVLQGSNHGHRCIYLTPAGCRWRISPIVCAMFLCDEAESCMRDDSVSVAEQWLAFEKERRKFTWPDRPVLFDALEGRFLDAGLSSPLMHLNSSPGLLALKRKAGLLLRTPAKKKSAHR